MRAIEIVEVSPRDGLQNERLVASTSAKVELINQLVAAGARRIEAVSFVNPRLVPTMADAEAVMAQVQRSSDVRYIGLALNTRGVQRAVDAGVDEINFVLPATDEFAMANQNTTREKLLREAAAGSMTAADAGVGFSVTIAVAFGCPFKGRVDAAEVGALVASVNEQVTFDELALADTIGCGVPSQVSELFALDAVRAAPKLRAHFHETRHTAIANAFAAVAAGVHVLDSSVGGLGGCPFAPGAAGNVATEDLVWALEAEGFTTGIDLQAAVEAGRMICDEVQVTPRSGLAQAGVFPPLVPLSVPKQRSRG